MLFQAIKSMAFSFIKKVFYLLMSPYATLTSPIPLQSLDLVYIPSASVIIIISQSFKLKVIHMIMWMAFFTDVDSI